MNLDTTPNRYVPGKIRLEPEDAALIARRNATLATTYRLLYSRPVHAVRGEGAYLIEANGNRLLDFYNNVAQVGHCHPHVVAETCRQVGVLATNTRYLHPAVVDYSERLLGHFPAELDRLIFTCSGSEANDLALRLAFHLTGASGVIVTEWGYHGTSYLTASVSPNLGKTVPLAAGVRYVPLPAADEVNPRERLRHSVEAAIADLARHGIRPAAFIADSIFASDGVFADPAGFLSGAVEAIREAGGLFISDEVQPGFGRTGAMWGFERHGVVPDFATLGKPMGNGYPVGALVGRSAAIDSIGAGLRYFNTFAGNNVAVAAAAAVLDVVEGEQLAERAKRYGRALGLALDDVVERHECLGAVRGAGLYFGIDVIDPMTGEADAERASAIVDAMRDQGVLISLCGQQANILKCRPPLIIGDVEVHRFVTSLEAASRRSSVR